MNKVGVGLMIGNTVSSSRIIMSPGTVDDFIRPDGSPHLLVFLRRALNIQAIIFAAAQAGLDA